jgi:hypothetical protein
MRRLGAPTPAKESTMRRLTLILLVLLQAACEGTSHLSPTEPPAPTPTPTSNPPTYTTESTWSGTTTVESLQGMSPSCLPSFLRDGYAAAISAEFQAEPDSRGRRLLVLKEPGSGEHCTLEIRSAADDPQIHAVTYYRKPMDDVSFDCHFLLRAARQECPSLEVWDLDVTLEGTFSRDRRSLSGTLSRGYDFRFDANNEYQRFMIEKRFVARQVTP